MLLYLTIHDVNSRGIPLSNRGVAAGVKQLKLEGFRLDWARVGARVNHYILLQFSRVEFQGARQVKALSFLGAPFYRCRDVCIASAYHRDSVGWVRCIKALGALFEHHHTGLWKGR